MIANPPASSIWPGRSSPLGETFDRLGVNFALFSEHATKVELCLFDSPDATTESARITLREKTDQVWHGYLPGIRRCQPYSQLNAYHLFNTKVGSEMDYFGKTHDIQPVHRAFDRHSIPPERAIAVITIPHGCYERPVRPSDL